VTEYKTGQQVWVAKPALTTGIHHAKIYAIDYRDLDGVEVQTGWAWVESSKIMLSTQAPIKSYLKADRDFFATKEAAIERANALRSKQIAALERRIGRLKELEF
jgi:hypothetical protein